LRDAKTGEVTTHAYDKLVLWIGGISCLIRAETCGAN